MVRTAEDLKNLTLSPSSINTYFQCPRKWYFNYVLGLKDPVTSAMLRGTVAHECIEDLFRATKYVNPKTFFKKALPKKWEKYNVKKVAKEDNDELFAETAEMLKMFAIKLDQKIKIALMSDRIKDKSHAWNTVKPKFREQNIKSETYNVRGIIDSIEDSKFDNRITLVDYKTSKIYKHQISEDYIRQVKLYALMYYDVHGRYPDYLVVDYLKSGDSFVFPFRKDMIKQAEIAIKYVRDNTQSTNIEDYPCSDHQWCKYGDHTDEDVPENLRSFAFKDGKQKTLDEM